jgi:hypothetical protein
LIPCSLRSGNLSANYCIRSRFRAAFWQKTADFREIACFFPVTGASFNQVGAAREIGQCRRFHTKGAVGPMLSFLKLLLIAPFAILFLIFAFANGQFVTVSFDPLASGEVPAYSIEARMFIVLTVAIMIGVVAGGVATWFGQGKHRRAARMYRAEADRLHGELQASKAALAPPLNSVKRA